MTALSVPHRTSSWQNGGTGVLPVKVNVRKALMFVALTFLARLAPGSGVLCCRLNTLPGLVVLSTYMLIPMTMASIATLPHRRRGQVIPCGNLS